MIYHVIGLAVMALTLLTGGGVTVWLVQAARTPAVTWHRPLVVPHVVADLHMSSGADYVGFV